MHFLFDVDGVLLETGHWARVLSEKYGLNSDESFEYFKGDFQDCLVGNADLYVTLEPFVKKWKFPLSTAEFIAEWFETDSVKIPETWRLFTKLKQRKSTKTISLLTNQEKYRGNYLWNVLKWSRHFDNIFASYNMKMAKPEFELFLAVQKKLHAFPNEIYYIDDNKANIESANSLGWNTFHFSDPSVVQKIEDTLIAIL